MALVSEGMEARRELEAVRFKGVLPDRVRDTEEEVEGGPPPPPPPLPPPEPPPLGMVLRGGAMG